MPDYFYENVAVFFQLRRADSVDSCQTIEILREIGRHFLQGTVMKDGEGRQVGLIGDFFSLLPEDFKQDGIMGIQFIFPTFAEPARLPPCLFQPPHDGLFAAQDFPRLPGSVATFRVHTRASAVPSE